jgi:opacity protein-like surface antigen
LTALLRTACANDAASLLDARCAAWAVRLALLGATLLPIARPAVAQSASGGVAGITVSAMDVDNDASVAVGGLVGYRFTPTVAIGLDFTFVPDFTPTRPDFPVPLAAPSPVIFPPPVIDLELNEGRATILAGVLRLSVPTRSARLSPYVIGGAGVGSVTDEIRYTIDYPPIVIAGGLPRIPTDRLQYPAFTQTVRRTTTDFAMTLGGGVGYALATDLSVDGDVRYIGIAGERDVHTGRFGVGLTYRF